MSFVEVFVLKRWVNPPQVIVRQTPVSQSNMMLSKKPGPPVPPRPSAKSLSSSQGRTVVYKSPAYGSSNKKPQECEVNAANQRNSISITTVTANTHSPPATRSNEHHSSDVSSSSNNVDVSPVALRLPNGRATVYDAAGSDDRAVNRMSSTIEVNQTKNTNVMNKENLNGTKHPVARPRQKSPQAILIESQQVDVDAVNDRSPENSDESTATVTDRTMENSYCNQLDQSSIGDDRIVTISTSTSRTTTISTDSANRVEIVQPVDFSAVAERLFTEITVGHSARVPLDGEENISGNFETKLEHCIQLRTPSPAISSPSGTLPAVRKSLVTLPVRPEPEGGEHSPPGMNFEEKLSDRKVTFHEMLISELAAMDRDDLKMKMPIEVTNDAVIARVEMNQRRISECSVDSLANDRARIRTSDWVEVGDNGKEVLLTSCQISLEDSGMEDEERLDDTSSGVGDSWDSIKEVEDR